MSIHIERTAGRDGCEQHTLYVNDFVAAHVVKHPDGRVCLNWAVYGPQHWPEAKLMLEGLLELGVLADQLTLGVLTRGKQKEAGRQGRAPTRDAILGVEFDRQEGDEDNQPTVERPGRGGRGTGQKAPSTRAAQTPVEQRTSRTRYGGRGS